MPDAPNRSRDGFTLIELLVVMAIIGILISLILVAAADGVRRAEERQTQALITKLESALTDRVDALLATPAPINQTHRYLAAVTFRDLGNGNFDPIDGSIERRAQVIAQFDFMKAELPDVFYHSDSPNYPLNFGMAPYPLTATGDDAFALPLGNRQAGLPYTVPPLTPPTPTYVPTPGFDRITGVNDLGVTAANAPLGLVVAQDSGIYGASFTAASGVYKNLYEAAALDVGVNAAIIPKRGYDAVDNDGDGLVDNIGEVTGGNAGAATLFQKAVLARLAKHTHKTARAEMLYALLVEGQGPLGSVYNREDFTNRDVADTDGDGLPEFVDAWGGPLQFFRWPIYYGSLVGNPTAGSSDSQLGFQAYNVTQNTARQLDPLDPNQLLVSVSWWTAFNPSLPSMAPPATIPDFSAALSVNGLSGAGIFSTSPASQQANAFMTYFHTLIDPQPPGMPGNPYWDRTSQSRRRAFYSKFLVLSSGPDKEPGVFQLNKDYSGLPNSGTGSLPYPLSSTFGSNFPVANNPVANALMVNWCESQAAQVDIKSRYGNFLESVHPPSFYTSPQPPEYWTTDFLQNNAAFDDITNHALTAPGSGAK